LNPVIKAFRIIKEENNKGKKLESITIIYSNLQHQTRKNTAITNNIKEKEYIYLTVEYMHHTHIQKKAEPISMLTRHQNPQDSSNC